MSNDLDALLTALYVRIEDRVFPADVADIFAREVGPDEGSGSPASDPDEDDPPAAALTPC